MLVKNWIDCNIKFLLLRVINSDMEGVCVSLFDTFMKKLYKFAFSAYKHILASIAYLIRV